MSDNILDYLKKYGDTSLSDVSFNNVDSAILCQLVYLKFDGLIPEYSNDPEGISLRQISEHKDHEGLFADKKYEKLNRHLFELLISSKRFCDVRLRDYRNIIDKETQIQFCAVTYLLPDGQVYICFRGTDETLVGWKEDFNMTYLDAVPAQKSALEYLTSEAELIDGCFIVGGHSKGGNLSVYASMNAPQETRDRITKIYSFDGPGFRKEVINRSKYDDIRDRIVKLIPQSSVVGLLAEYDRIYKVIKSSSIGLSQHLIYNWTVEDRDFAPGDDIKGPARIFDTTFNEWIEGLDEEKRKSFSDCMYAIIDSCDANDRIAFAESPLKNMNKILSAARGLDEGSAKMLRSIAIKFFEEAGTQIRSEIGRK
ncbi:MAG: DUF2974 domain-containing protein [Lachnospiraceae bacterium]|nr:DUF2974 domain-containing protein [Lachnospiraceae bacterium]